MEKPARLEYFGTLGPACADPDILTELFEAGMTGVRLNLSHTSLDRCGGWLRSLRVASSRTGARPELLIDLRGPELRIGELAVPVRLARGERAVLGKGGLPVPGLIFSALCPGQEILLDDGALLLRALRCDEKSADCEVLRGGTLQSRKSIALPGAALHPPTLQESDRENLARIGECGVTGVMLPFVRGADDLTALRDALSAAGAEGTRVFAKLENREGLAMLPELLPHADHIVIARGDLGNDLPLWELPAAQKSAAETCRAAEKPFMVVTQLLHSMHHSAVPTRAEVCDIFNAVLDGASSLMLTGETAVGEHPAAAMRVLVKTGEEALRWRAAH